MAAVAATLTLLWGALSPGTSAAAMPGPCDALVPDSVMTVDQTRIGPFPAASSLASLRTMCPDAFPTLGSGFESVWAALDLSIGATRILAGQNWRSKAAFDDPDTPEPEVDWSRAPSHWVIQGCGGRLPGGVSTCGTWQDLSAAYGPVGRATAEFGPVVVSLAALPGYQFELDVTDEVVGSIELHGDLSRIPATAKIVEVDITVADARAHRLPVLDLLAASCAPG